MLLYSCPEFRVTALPESRDKNYSLLIGLLLVDTCIYSQQCLELARLSPPPHFAAFLIVPSFLHTGLDTTYPSFDTFWD